MGLPISIECLLIAVLATAIDIPLRKVASSFLGVPWQIEGSALIKMSFKEYPILAIMIACAGLVMNLAAVVAIVGIPLFIFFGW